MSCHRALRWLDDRVRGVRMGCVFPDLKAFGSRGQGVVQIRYRRVRHAADDLAGGGVVHGNDGVAFSSAPFVVDHELNVGVGGGGHGKCKNIDNKRLCYD